MTRDELIEELKKCPVNGEVYMSTHVERDDGWGWVQKTKARTVNNTPDITIEDE